MAKFLLTSNLSSVTGSLAGNTFFAGNTFGIVRQKISLKEVHSKQTAVNRAAIYKASKAWKKLTELQRSQWYNANENGRTGFALFRFRNFYRIRSRGNITSAYTFRPIPSDTVWLNQFSVSLNGTLTFNIGGTFFPAGTQILLYLTRIQPLYRRLPSKASVCIFTGIPSIPRIYSLTRYAVNVFEWFIPQSGHIRCDLYLLDYNSGQLVFCNSIESFQVGI